MIRTGTITTAGSKPTVDLGNGETVQAVVARHVLDALVRGTRVIVAFVDDDPMRPVIVGNVTEAV